MELEYKRIATLYWGGVSRGEKREVERSMKIVGSSWRTFHSLRKHGMRLSPHDFCTIWHWSSPPPPTSRYPQRTYLLCLEAMLQLKSQLIRLALHQACGPEARSGLHAECGITRPLPHAVEVGVLHGRIASLGHLCLRRILLWENRCLLLQHHVGILTRELVWIYCLALKRKSPRNKEIKH